MAINNLWNIYIWLINRNKEILCSLAIIFVLMWWCGLLIPAVPLRISLLAILADRWLRNGLIYKKSLDAAWYTCWFDGWANDVGKGKISKIIEFQKQITGTTRVLADIVGFGTERFFYDFETLLKSRYPAFLIVRFQELRSAVITAFPFVFCLFAMHFSWNCLINITSLNTLR